MCAVKQANIFKNNTIVFNFIMFNSIKGNIYTATTFVIHFTV